MISLLLNKPDMKVKVRNTNDGIFIERENQSIYDKTFLLVTLDVIDCIQNDFINIDRSQMKPLKVIKKEMVFTQRCAREGSAENPPYFENLPKSPLSGETGPPKSPSKALGFFSEFSG